MNQQKLIEKIHAEFDSAQDRLLQQANEIIAQELPAETKVESVSERLKRVGFTNTPTVKKGEQISEQRKQKHSQIVESREQAELIQYYKQTYPFMKFLTESELNSICEKYNLTHAPASNYIGEVPMKNLEDIENAQTRKDQDSPNDIKYTDVTYHSHLFGGMFLSIWNAFFWKAPRRIEGVLFNTWQSTDDFLRKNYKAPKDTYLTSKAKCYTEDRSGIFICAPKSQFKGKPLNISFYEIQDPIVFRYVRGGIQVITKWGLEANDPALVLPIDN